MEHPHGDNIDHEDTGVVAKLVSKESNNWRSYKNTEGKNAVNESHVNITDTDILHVDGEVGKDGISCSREHEQGAFEGEKISVHFATRSGPGCHRSSWIKLTRV